MKTCDRFTPKTGSCRKKARVLVRFQWHNCTNRDGAGILYRCWPHYLAIETKARQPGANFHINSAVEYNQKGP
jgi:hypothetical protein